MKEATIDASKIPSCLVNQDIDMVEIKVKLAEDKVETHRLRPVTDGERARARKESRMGRATLTIDEDGKKSYSESINTETYNAWMLYFALGGERKIGRGDNEEGWNLKDKNGEPLKVTFHRVRDDMYPGLTKKLIDKLWELTELTEGSEKN